MIKQYTIYEARAVSDNEEGINAENKKGMITHHCRYEAPQFENALPLIRRDKAPFLFFAFNLVLAAALLGRSLRSTNVVFIKKFLKRWQNN